MSKTLVQPVGQKRLTNVAVVRLKKQGNRFEIACYKNKVLSWRSGVEKDIDEVLQSHTVYSNVSKGVLAKSKDLVKSFGSDDHTIICMEILDKGELQVAGKERESQFSSQFRDIATIVLQKTINPETQRPYTITMVERLMHEIHFAVDPHSNSKKQALDVIRELQKHFPIKRSPMRLRLTVPLQSFPPLLEKIKEWDGSVVSKDESGTQMSTVCEMEPSLYRECNSLVRSMQGKLEILAVSVHAEGDTSMDQYDEHDDMTWQAMKPLLPIEADAVVELGKKMEKQEMMGTTSNIKKEGGGEAKETKCSTCDAFVGFAKQYREHFKSDWHKHNLKRKTRKLPPISADECSAEIDMDDSRDDLKDYSF
ncbi:unnamed protein product [Cochlearia groenlandica]